ncbi:MAG TPA: hypothetical protein VGE52_05410, partial [Pirellulales bacterium]
MGDGDRGKSTFDPYYTWLGIPPSVPRPPNHYVLLGLPAFESDPNMIASFADKQMTFVQTFKTGPHSAVSQQILNELAQARITLLNPQRRAAYDEQLRATLAAAAPPVAVPAAAPSVASIPPSFEFGLPFPAGEATSLPTPARKPPVGGTRAASIPLPIMAGVGVGVVAALLAVAVIVAAGQPKRNAVGVAIVESTVTRAVTATPEPPSASPESPTPRAAVPSPAPLPKPKFAARVVADPEVQLTGEPAAGMSAQPEPTAAAPSAPPAVDPPAVLVETPAIDLLKTLP